MERVLSPDEKIRRAEEIYARRLQNGVSRVATVNVDNKTQKNSYVKKLCKQCIICLIIYILFYSIKNSESILPQNILNKINEILQYDINIEALQGNIDNYIIKLNENENTDKEENNENENLVEDTLGVTDVNDTTNNELQETNIVQEASAEETPTEESSSIDQMQVDAEYIKAN